jgi:hypothetical protein
MTTREAHWQTFQLVAVYIPPSVAPIAQLCVAFSQSYLLDIVFVAFIEQHRLLTENNISVTSDFYIDKRFEVTDI